MPPFTVGDFMHRWDADIGADPSARRSAFDAVNSSGLDVGDLAYRVPYVLGGGYLGRQAAKYLGAGTVGKFVGGVVGSIAGNHVFNRISGSQDPMARRVFPGVVNRGW